MPSRLTRQGRSNGERSFGGAASLKNPAICNAWWPKFVVSYCRFWRRLPPRSRSPLVGNRVGRGGEAGNHVRIHRDAGEMAGPNVPEAIRVADGIRQVTAAAM
jgi:hypothetical protein